jgi:molybdopterin converting factor small subunit
MSRNESRTRRDGETATIEIRTYKGLKRAVGRGRLEWDVDPGATVGDVLSEFAREHGIDDSDVLVMKNGTHVRFLDGERTSVEGGDRLSFS